MGFIKRHPIQFAILGFLLVTLPGAINSWLSLAERFGQAEGVAWQLILTDWVFPILGLILLVVVIRQRGGVKPPIFPKDEKAAWLKQALEEDRTNLANRVHIKTPIQWFNEGLNDTEPSIQAKLCVINAACFPIIIKGVQGSLTIQGTRCNFDLKMEGGSRIPHGELGNIRLIQRVTKETVNKIVTLNNERGGFMVDFTTCQLIIQPEILGEEREPSKIGIGIREQINL